MFGSGFQTRIRKLDPDSLYSVQVPAGECEIYVSTNKVTSQIRGLPTI